MDRGKYRSYQSDVVAVDTALTIDFIDPALPHNFVGFQFFSDAAGTTPVTPSSGTVDIGVGTINSYPEQDSVTAQQVDLADGDFTVSWAANTVNITATPDSVVGASYWKMKVTCNLT